MTQVNATTLFLYSIAYYETWNCEDKQTNMPAINCIYVTQRLQSMAVRNIIHHLDYGKYIKQLSLIQMMLLCHKCTIPVHRVGISQNCSNKQQEGVTNFRWKSGKLFFMRLTFVTFKSGILFTVTVWSSYFNFKPIIILCRRKKNCVYQRVCYCPFRSLLSTASSSVVKDIRKLSIAIPRTRKSVFSSQNPWKSFSMNIN